MTQIVPFKAVRPPADKVHLVASRSYVSYSPSSLKRKLTENPYTFIHIINPEFGELHKTKPNSIERFNKVKAKYEAFLKEQILVQDQTPGIYIYRQWADGVEFTGIVCGVSIDDYANGDIKIHEHTLTQREETFCKYLETCNFNAEPVLLTYRENPAALQELLMAVMKERPVYDFSSTDKHRHMLWQINEDSLINQFIALFKDIPQLYIADGHHRMSSSALLGDKRRREQPANVHAMHNFALAMIMPAAQLDIKPFHRLIQTNHRLDEIEFFKQLSKHFHIDKHGQSFLPPQKHQWGLKLASGWYRLSLIRESSSESPAEKLDAMILSRKILEPIFGITDQKTDPRIKFIPGNESLDAYSSAIDKGKYSALFTLYKVEADDLFAVSDANEIMPPKSTWIAPKLRSGLTIMSLS